MKYFQDDLLENYLEYWYNKVANVRYVTMIPEKELLSFIEDKNDLPIAELAQLHSKYNIWRNRYLTMEPAMCLELYYGYIKRMEAKEKVKGNEIIQRFVLEQIINNVEEKHKKDRFKQYNSYFGTLIYIFLYVLAIYLFVKYAILD